VPREVNDSSAHKDDARALRVLLVVESSAGGTGRHVMDLAEGLLARGCDVHLIHSSGRVDQMFLDRVARLDPSKVLSLPMRRAIHPGDWRIVRAMRRYMRSAGPFDIIHGHSSKGGAIARLAALGTGAKTLYTIHGIILADPGLSRLKRLLYQSIELLLSRFTSRIIAVSPEEQRKAIQFRLGSSRVILVPNGVDAAGSISRAEARRGLALLEDEFVIGFVGRLVEQKAPDVLLRAFAKATDRSTNARLAIVGNGPLLTPLQDLASRLNITDRVLWLGERDARLLYPAFDAFAIASQKEGLPYVVLEAMAAGLSIVATQSAGVELLVTSGSNGCVVPMGDVHAFAAALREIMLDPALCQRYGKASQQRSRLFTIDRMVNQTLHVYQDVLQAKPAGSIFEQDDPILAGAEGEAS
jgi:glycosyltransferase involved in cell wall biosynthesis